MAGKADIVDAIADGVEGITKKQAAEAFDATVETIASLLKDGERVQIPGLGSFSVTRRTLVTGSSTTSTFCATTQPALLSQGW